MILLRLSMESQILSLSSSLVKRSLSFSLFPYPLLLSVVALAALPFWIGCAMLPPAVAAAKAIVSLFFLRVFVYRQGITGAPKYEYAKRGK